MGEFCKIFCLVGGKGGGGAMNCLGEEFTWGGLKGRKKLRKFTLT